jgi:hypothetical protein
MLSLQDVIFEVCFLLHNPVYFKTFPKVCFINDRPVYFSRMDSFLLSETLKYLYLLFTDKEDLPINLHDFVFTTEAHILPLALSNWNGSSSQVNVVRCNSYLFSRHWMKAFSQ